MARATIQQVLTIVEGLREQTETLTTLIVGDKKKGVIGLNTEIELLKQRNRFEDTLANVAVGVGSALLVFLLTNGCTRQAPDPDPTLTPVVSPTLQKCVCPTPTAAPTPTASPTASPTATLAPADTPVPLPNLLLNPGFEGDVYRITPDWLSPVGWWPWSGCEIGKVHSELEAHPPHVRGGRFAARVWQAWSTCEMGLYQQVDALPGAVYQLAGYGFSWSTGNPVVGSPSEAYVKAWVGIDPVGGADPTASSVVWSEENAARDEYGEFHLTAQARHTRITVFLRSKPDWGLARSDTFWDDVTLYEVERPGADTTPLPTLTPAIAEATPLGGEPVLAAGDKMEDVRGTFTPNVPLRVRACTVANPSCEVLDHLFPGVPVPVYARVTVYPSEDVWLCLDASTGLFYEDLGSQCGKVAAYQIDDTTFGDLVLNEEK